MRPCFFFASGVNIVRTRDGETLEMRRIPLLRVDKGHAVKERYMLGVRFSEGTEGTAAGPRRVLYEVMEGAAAAEAGLKKGDAIISVDGQVVSSIDELVSLMDRKPGQAVTIEYSRKGKIDKVAITPRLGTGVVKTKN